MADNLTTATIDVRANTRGMERDILKALQTVELSQINTKKSSQALGRITGQVSEFNKSLEASNARVVAFGASAGAIFAVEKALSSLISSTINVQKQLADVNVLLNLSSSSLEKFGSSLFDIARNTAQSFSEVATAATELSRQGLGVEETLKRTNAALILTRLSGLDAKSSVEALTATLNSFSGSALDAVEVVNKLANVDAAFAVSSADLANAISRVGSTAVDAGVSLDELIALVTSAQQTTARGGAVIGNSFKTIFTRLQRGKVQDLLGSLGVDTGEGQSAISLLQQLASTYDTLGASQKSYVAEQVGGVFQINILKAALSDLGKEYSIYGRALDTSLSSTDEAIRRNELLNKTVSALSSQTVASLEQAANKIGSIVFEPNAKGFLSGFNNLLESFNNIDAESAGGKLMTGFFKGIGDFIGGPGAVLATAVLVKLFARLGQFAAGSAKELLGTNKAAQQQAAIEQSILSILQKNSQFTSQILAGKMTTVQAEKQMLDYLTAQSNILREQERLSKVIGANLAMKGVSVGASGIPMTAPTKKTKVAASGYIPNFAADMAVGQAMENAGAKQHGYTAGKAKKTTIHDGNGKSFKSFVNNKEDVKTFTNAAGKKATVVRPPNGFGENTQYAAGGFVPNFVKNQASIRSGVVFEKRLNKSLKGTPSFSPNAPMDFPLPEGYGANNQVKSALGISDDSIYGDAKITRSRKSEQSLLDKYLRTAEGRTDFLSSKESKKGFINLNPKGLSMLFSGSGADARGVAYISTLSKSLSAGAQGLIKTKFGKSAKSRTLAMPYIADKINTNALSALSSGYIPNFASMGSKFKAMYGGGTTMRAVDKEKTAKKKNLDVKKLDLSDRYTMVHGGNQGLDSANVSLEAGNKLFDAKIATAGLDTAGTNLQRYGIKGVVGDALVGATNNIIKTFGGTEQITDASSLDNAGSVGSAAGTVFETALRKAFNAPAVSQTQRIDFPAPTPELKKFFHNAPGQYEAKISRTPDNLKSTLKKWVDVNGLASSASGYIPNLAKSSGLSYSYKDKDEFGFSEIQAIMSGKKVGSFSYAEDKKGEVDVGDFSVNKGERGKGIGSGLYKEAIRRNAGKKMKGQLLPQMNRLLQKIKNGEPISAETLYPQIKRADLAKSSMFEVYGHKGMTVEKMTRDQFSSFVNAKINELKKDPKKLQSFFGNVEADEYGGLGVDLQTQHSAGFIPNFSSALSDAVAREQSSGLSKSQIYVDKHSSLKNKNNPMGLMVANRRDEPGGGIQGINRAKKEGRNPKTYGGGMSSGFVPNFAANDPGVLEGMIGKAVEGNGSEIESGRKAVEKSLKKFPELGSEFERVAKQFEGLNSDVDNWIKKIRELNSSASKSQAPSRGGEANINASQLSGREIVFSRAGAPDKEKAAAKTRDRRAEAEYKARRAAEGEGSYQTFAMSGSGPAEASAKKNRKQRSLDYLRGGGSMLGGKAKDSMLGKGMGYLKQNSMGIGFGLQAAAGMAGEYAGNDDTQTGRGIKAGAGAFGDIASFAGTGAMIAGPYGALAGALVGAAKGAVDMHKALTTKVPDLEKALQASSDAANRFGESGQKLLILNEQYGDAMMSGNPAQAADIMIKTQQAYAEELSKLTEVQRSSMISAIAQGKGQEEYTKILSEMQNSVKAQETATQLTKFSESGGIFSAPDKKLLAGMDKGLALDFTKGMDTASVTAALEKSAASLSDMNRGTENQALDLMKNLASSDSLTVDQKENLNKMIEAFSNAAENTDLSGVAEGFIKSIKEKPKSDADVKKAQQAAKVELEARAAKVKKEIEIREKTNAMLIKLQSDTEAVYQRYNNSMEDFISSIQTASEMISAAGQFREEYLVQSGANRNITDPIKEKNIVNKSNADLKVGVYKSQLDTSKNFNEGVKSLLSGLEADSAKAAVGQSTSDQSSQFLEMKSKLEQALLPVEEMITNGNYEGAKSKTQEVFNNLKPEERAAIGEDKITSAVKQLNSGIDKGSRSQDLLVKNSQKDLAIQAQQLIFQKAMTKLTQAQNFGGTTNQILGDTEDSPFNKAIEAVTSAKIMGYNQKGLQPGSVSAVEGGDRNSLGVDGKKPSIGTAEQIVNFYKAAGEIGGESVMSTDSKDFAVLTQAIREQTRKKLDELRSAGEGVVDPAVFTRLETTLATLGGGDQVAQLKLMKELGFANISGKKITDTAMKGYSGGAFAGLDPALKKGFEATSDEGASATMLLLADQKNQTDSLNKGLENVVGTGLETNTLLSQQPSAIAAAIGAILEKGRAEQKMGEEKSKATDLNKKYTDTSNQIQENSKLIKQSEQQMQSAQNVLGKIPEGVSTEEFIKQQEASIDKGEVEKAKKLVGNYAKGEGMSKRDKTSALVAGVGNQALGAGALAGELLSFNQLDFGSSDQFKKAEQNYAVADTSPEDIQAQYDKALELIQRASALDTLKTSSDVVKNKTKDNEGLSKAQQETVAKQNESAAKMKVVQEDLFKKTAEANIKKTETLGAGGAGGRAYIEANKAARDEAFAKNLAAQGGDVLNEQQKKSRARTSGAELTYDKFAGQKNTFEVAAMNEFGGANRKSFDKLISQQTLPSFEKFSKIYEEDGGAGYGKEFYQQKKADLLGADKAVTKPTAPAATVPIVTPTVAPGATVPAPSVVPGAVPTAPPASQPAAQAAINQAISTSSSIAAPTMATNDQEVALQQQASIQRANEVIAQKKSSAGSGITVQENQGFLENFGYTQGEGFKSEQDKADYEQAIKTFKEKKKSKSPSGSPAAVTQPSIGQIDSQVNKKIPDSQKAQEQKKVETNTQEQIVGIISSILTSINELKSGIPGASGTDGGTANTNSSQSGAVSVSTPVNLSINSTAGENKTEVASVADKIKTDLTAFLSSPEFMERVTTIAKTAAGNPPPPKSRV